jgi:hypothetical protein
MQDLEVKAKTVERSSFCDETIAMLNVLVIIWQAVEVGGA